MTEPKPKHNPLGEALDEAIKKIEEIGASLLPPLTLPIPCDEHGYATPKPHTSTTEQSRSEPSVGEIIKDIFIPPLELGLKDVDFSNPESGIVCTGTGIPPKQFSEPVKGPR